MNNRKALFSILSVAVLLAASDAKAAFTYSVSPVTIFTNFGAGSNYTITAANSGAASPVLAGDQTINLAQTTQTSTRVAPPTDTGAIPVTLTVTINNQNGGGSNAFTLSGTINVTRSDTLGADSNFVLTSILPPSITLGNFVYTLSNPTYTAPTIQGSASANGGLSVRITETSTAVPEPASLALMGTGILALGGLRVLRRRRQG